jgi:hypothetical protein
MTTGREQFVGYWRIESMEVWDDLDLVVEAHIEFEGRNGGSFQFIAVSGDIDYRVSTDQESSVIEWSWLGDDDGHETGGRGWATREGEKLVGRFYIHGGDDSAFVASKHRPAKRANRSHRTPRKP